MKISIITFIIFFALPLSKIEAVAQEQSDVFSKSLNKDQLPVPKEKNQLFYLQRDPNSNTVVYTVNLNEGKIDEQKPINIHWIRYAEGGKRIDLSFIQRKMAYGVHHTKVSKTEFEIRIQAYKDLPIILKYNKDVDKYQTFTFIKNKKVVLERIFVRITGGSIFNPHVKYVEVSGYDPTTAKKVTHQFVPE